MKSLLLSILSFTAICSFSQSKQMAEKEFIYQLNQLIKNSPSQHWAYKEPFTVDSAFHLIGNNFTATFKYVSDTSVYWIRYAAPINRINSIIHDIYLVLVMQGKEVQVYERIGKSKTWTAVEKRDHLHIAIVENDKQEKIKEAIEKAWSNLRLFYYDE